VQHPTGVLLAAFLAGASATPSQGADPPPPGPVTITGWIDVYGGLNFNHPASRYNQLRNFDVRANQFSLNLAKVAVTREPAPLGFRFDGGLGRALELVHAGEGAPGMLRHVEQVYFSYQPPRARGFQLDIGKYVTSAGAEVIETWTNWNYSRSLLFAWAVPYYHFGVRAAMPLGRNLTAGLQVANGWNNVEDNNRGKTVGLSGAYSRGAVSWTNTYYTGPEKADPGSGYRHLYDTTVLVTPRPQVGFYVNFDYGVDRKPGAAGDRWAGVAGAARFALASWVALSPRAEWFNDADGFATGAAQRLKEVTLTAEFRMSEEMATRVEYRRDWSDRPFFDRGSSLAAARGQTTLLVGWLARFGWKK